MKTYKGPNMAAAATLFEDPSKAVDQIDLIAIERELRLKQENLEEVISRLEKSKHISPEVLKLKISI